MKLQRKAKHFYIRTDGLIGNKTLLSGGVKGVQLYETVAVPITKRETILHTFHGWAHIGINKAFRQIRERYFWPNLQKDVKEFIKGCHNCRTRKDPRPARKGHLTPFLHLSKRPWDTVTMDLYGPLPESQTGHKYLLIIVDHLTKWPEAIPLKTKQAEEIAKVLYDEFICKYSLPSKILSDNEHTLLEESMNRMWQLYGTSRITSSISHPDGASACARSP
jgi:hypothetical protein